MKQPLDQFKQISDFLCHHHKYHHQACQHGHHRLLVPSGTGQHLVQYGYDDADGGDFEYQVDLHRLQKQDRQSRTCTQAQSLIAADSLGTVTFQFIQLP